MKRNFLVLAIVLIALPVRAGITIWCEGTQYPTIQYEGTDCNEVPIYYDMDDGDANLPRSFALEISLSQENGANIGEVTYVHPEFYVYPGSVVIAGGQITDQGTPVAESDASSMIIEMGSLYAAGDPCHTSPPPENGVLLVFKIANDKGCHVNLAQNAIRGGVIMEDPTGEFPPSYVTLFGCEWWPPPCFPMDHPDYCEWVLVGEPDSWCYPRQCHGDADGEQEQMGKPYYWVSNNDLDILLEGFGELEYVDPETDPWIAADFTHAEEQMGKPYYRVSTADLNILLAYYGNLTVDPNCLDVP